MTLAPTAAPATESLELDVSGMTCAACAGRVERALNKLDGVTATVNYATERAVITGLPLTEAPRAIQQVAARLGNTPAICRKCYVHPVVVDRYLGGGRRRRWEGWEAARERGIGGIVARTEPGAEDCAERTTRRCSSKSRGHADNQRPDTAPDTCASACAER